MLSGVIASAAGCCSFGNRHEQMNVAAARELTAHGLAALHRSRADEATTLLRQACAATPDDPRVHRHLAAALVEQNEIEPAIAQLRLAIEKAPDDPALHVEIGRLYLRVSRPNEARHHAMLALEFDRRSSEAWLLRGLSEKSTGQLDQALDMLHRAAVHDPHNMGTRLELADTWLLRGEPLRALTALEIHNSGFADEQLPIRAVELTGLALVELQQNERATRMLTAATGREDSTADVWLLLSRSLLQSGDRSGAELAIRSARQVFPENQALRERERQIAEDLDSALQASR